MPDRSMFSVSQLLSIVRQDQQSSWHSGHPIRVEKLFEEFPSLAGDHDSAVDLIYSEFCLREKLGHQPRTHEFLERFPNFERASKELFDAHSELDPSELLDTWGPGTGVPSILRPGESTVLSRQPRDDERVLAEPSAQPVSNEAAQPLSDQGPVTHQEEQDVQETLTESELQPVSDQRTTTSHQGVESVTRLRIIRPHAEGGLGRVSVALDDRLNRQVAFKEIKPRHADNRNARQRFVQEAEITGGLEHPGIVPVYGLGQFDDGRPFYSMRFIQGQSLHEASQAFHESVDGAAHGSRSNPDFASTVGFRQLISRFIDVCNAVGYAHSRGVLHRDLKPGNIMVGNYGETLVVDWGLAKAAGHSRTGGDSGGTSTNEGPLNPRAAERSAETQIGSAVGTPQFMSPEQPEGRVNELDQTSDIYSLGATLYQLLTGCKLMSRSRTGQESSSPSVKETLRRVSQGDFARPHK